MDIAFSCVMTSATQSSRCPQSLWLPPLWYKPLFHVFFPTSLLLSFQQCSGVVFWVCAVEPFSQAVLGPLTLSPCPSGPRQTRALAAQIPGFILSPLRGLKSSSQESTHPSSPSSGQQPGLAHHLEDLGQRLLLCQDPAVMWQDRSLWLALSCTDSSPSGGTGPAAESKHIE